MAIYHSGIIGRRYWALAKQSRGAGQTDLHSEHGHWHGVSALYYLERAILRRP